MFYTRNFQDMKEKGKWW